MDHPAGVSVREVTEADLAAVIGILDAAMLQTDRERLRKRIAAGSVLVACSREAQADIVLGTLVLDGSEITAIAVRPRRRGQGIGTRLVDEAAKCCDGLVASFDPRVREFWAGLGFEIERGENTERLRGSLEGRPDSGFAGVE
jgi:GNAT superfamily N-acetyltransferase